MFACQILSALHEKVKRNLVDSLDFFRAISADMSRAITPSQPIMFGKNRDEF